MEEILPIFNSPSIGRVSIEEMIARILAYIHHQPAANYSLAIGTDSCVVSGGVEFVCAIAVRRIGNGGIYFWQSVKSPVRMLLRQRIYQEALISLAVAEEFIKRFYQKCPTVYEMEIHVDIGPNGETKGLIKEITGMIRGSGYQVKIKPSAFTAATIADRYL